MAAPLPGAWVSLAVIASPASVGDFLSAKGLTGTLLAFGQAGLVLLLVGGFAQQPLLVALAEEGTYWMTGNVIRVDGGEDFVGTMPS